MLAAKQILIGTRKSRLALIQAQEIKDHIINSYPEYQSNPDLVSIVKFKTTGDIVVDRSLVDIGGKGLFTKEIEEALLNNKIDIAVHSAKDMPAFYKEGLKTVAIPRRNDSRDAFISAKYSSIKDLPNGAIVGTASPRRKALILNQRPDLKIINFRGNVETRLNKLLENEVDATILAVAGLERLSINNDNIYALQHQEMLPAIGQGALIVQSKNDNQFIIDLLAKINHIPSQICVEAERYILKAINGSCNTPIAAYCHIENNKLHIKAQLSSPDGKNIYQIEGSDEICNPKKLGNDIGLEIKQHASHILQEIQRDISTAH
jgi:hydroxymethylbilane synthase